MAAVAEGGQWRGSLSELAGLMRWTRHVTALVSALRTAEPELQAAGVMCCPTGSRTGVTLAASQRKQRPYVATTKQIWGLYDVMPERIGAAVLLGAFAGLWLAESCGLRLSDFDFMRGIVAPGSSTWRRN